MFTREKRNLLLRINGIVLAHHHHYQERQQPQANGDTTPGSRRGAADLLRAGAKGGELEVTPE